MTNQTNTVTTQDKAPRPVELLKNILNADSVQQQFKNALDKSAGPFIAGVIDLFSTDTYLQKCEPKAVVMECLKAAVLKLPINKSLGFAYIVPYKKNGKDMPQFQMGYKGFIQLAMRTGQYRFINADMVYEGELKTVDKLTGEIDFTGERKSDKVVGYFAYIEMLNGFSKTFYMSKEDVTAHAKRFSKSYASQTSAWATDFDAMAKKTVIRNLLGHYGYLSIDMINAYDAEAAADNNEITDNANKQVIDIELAEEVKDEATQPSIQAEPVKQEESNEPTPDF